MLCEGKNDVWFFQELMDQHPTIDTKILPKYGNFADFQRNVLQDRCFNHISGKYGILMFGDTGRTSLYSQIFPEIVADLLGLYLKDINIFITLDEDGTNYLELKIKIKETIHNLSKDKNRFQVLPTYYENNESFFIQSPRTEGILKVKLLTVPMNIEAVVVKAFVKGKNLKEKRYDIARPGSNPHEVLKHLADDFYEGNKEKLIRTTVPFLKEANWVEDIIINFDN